MVDAGIEAAENAIEGKLEFEVRQAARVRRQQALKASQNRKHSPPRRAGDAGRWRGDVLGGVLALGLWLWLGPQPALALALVNAQQTSS